MPMQVCIRPRAKVGTASSASSVLIGPLPVLELALSTIDPCFDSAH